MTDPRSRPPAQQCRLLVCSTATLSVPPNSCAKAALSTSPKRRLLDPSLAVAALSSGPDRLIADLNLLDLLFASLVGRELRVLSKPLGGEVLHYLDNYGTEVDAFVQLPTAGGGPSRSSSVTAWSSRALRTSRASSDRSTSTARNSRPCSL